MPKRIQLLPVNDELIEISDEIKKQILSAVPEEIKAKAEKLLEALQKFGIYVTKDGNKISYLTTSSTGSSLLDLINWSLSEEKVPVPPDYRLFKKILSDANLPENVLPIKHKKKVTFVEEDKKPNTEWLHLY